MSLLAIRNLNSIARRAITYSRVACSGGSDFGSKSSGAGGSIKEGGGKFAEIETARESSYFKSLERRQLEQLRKHHDEEIQHHEEEIQRHLDSIKRHRERISDMHEDQKKQNKKD